MSAASKRSCIGLETSLADFWMGLMTAIRKAPPIDVMRNAKMTLRLTLDEIEDSELHLNAELVQLTRVVVGAQQARASGERVDVSRLKSTLMQSKKCRAKLATLAKKKLALENHMDTLDNSELNQHVLQSMQNTSHALKGMGLDKALESVDRVMMDLEDNNADLASLQTTLSTNVDAGDDFDWEAEMQLLLHDDVYFDAAPAGLPRAEVRAEVRAPVTANAIAVAATADAPIAAPAPRAAAADLTAAEAASPYAHVGSPEEDAAVLRAAPVLATA